MHVARDIDDTITHAPEFFRELTQALLGATISIVSYRDEEEEARALLANLGIRFDRLILSNDPELGTPPGQALDTWNVDVIRRIGADVLFDDMPEIVHRVQPPTKVFMSCDALMRGPIRDQLAT